MSEAITHDGAVLLDEYLKPLKPDEKRLKEVNYAINYLGEEAGYNALPAERESLRQLVAERKVLQAQEKGYSELDSSFLSIANPVQVNTQRIRGITLDVPKFSVYPVFGTNEFEIGFSWRWGSFDRYLSNGIIFQTPLYGNNGHRSTEWDGKKNGKTVPEVFGKYLRQSMEFYRLSNGQTPRERYKSLLRDVKKRYNKLTRSGITLMSALNVMLPAETKERTKEANGIFGNDIYFIAETLPEQWAVHERPRHMTADPLVVAVVGANCYLVDHFNTTPRERYISSEFTLPK